MATDQVDGDVAPPGGDGKDHISSLPDHLLHIILLRLPGGTPAAARTSVLSRRWRRVWAHLPDLLFWYKHCCHCCEDEDCCDDEDEEASTSAPPTQCAPDRVGAALAAHAAPTVGRLDITMPYDSSRHLTAEHVSSWLRFSSRCLAGELRLVVPRCNGNDDEGDDEDHGILLPPCERVTSIGINLDGDTLRFRLPGGGGAFRALSILRLHEASVDSRELEDMLAFRCPSLKNLELQNVSVSISLQGGAPVLSLRSGSLEWLLIVAIGFDGRLQVAAPKLRTFRGRNIRCKLYMAAPMLAELCWRDNNGYDHDSTRHRRAVPAGHHLRRLEIDASSSGLELIWGCKTVDELDLTVYVTRGIQDYRRFLEDTNKLARCEVLVVRFMKMEHSFKSAMLHLLKQCATVRKLVVHLSSNMDDYPCNLLSECPCSLPENRKINNTVLGMLEEVEVTDHGEAHNTVELVRFLCKCSKIQKRVAITVLGSKQSERIGMKVHSIVSPNTKVEMFVR